MTKLNLTFTSVRAVTALHNLDFIGWDELTHTLQSGFYLTVFLYHPTGIPKCTFVDGKKFYCMGWITVETLNC